MAVVMEGVSAGVDRSPCLSVEFSLASDYNSATLLYTTAPNLNSTNTMIVSKSAGFLTGATQMQLFAPDITTADGYQLAWAPVHDTNVPYQVTVSSSPMTQVPCAEGALLRTAFRSSNGG